MSEWGFLSMEIQPNSPLRTIFDSFTTVELTTIELSNKSNGWVELILEIGYDYSDEILISIYDVDKLENLYAELIPPVATVKNLRYYIPPFSKHINIEFMCFTTPGPIKLLTRSVTPEVANTPIPVCYEWPNIDGNQSVAWDSSNGFVYEIDSIQVKLITSVTVGNRRAGVKVGGHMGSAGFDPIFNNYLASTQAASLTRSYSYCPGFPQIAESDQVPNGGTVRMEWMPRLKLSLFTVQVNVENGFANDKYTVLMYVHRTPSVH